MDRSQTFTGLLAPLDSWFIRPSRLAAFYYFTLYFFILLLFFLLGYYQQRGLFELLIAFLLVILVGRRDYKELLRSRRAFYLTYGNKGWTLFEAQSKCDRKNQMNPVARCARVRVLLTSPICLVVEGEQGAENPGSTFNREEYQGEVLPGMIVWRDQLNYDSWRMLQSRLAAQ